MFMLMSEMPTVQLSRQCEQKANKSGIRCLFGKGKCSCPPSDLLCGCQMVTCIESSVYVTCSHISHSLFSSPCLCHDPSVSRTCGCVCVCIHVNVCDVCVSRPSVPSITQAAWRLYSTDGARPYLRATWHHYQSALSPLRHVSPPAPPWPPPTSIRQTPTHNASTLPK